MQCYSCYNDIPPNLERCPICGVPIKGHYEFKKLQKILKDPESGIRIWGIQKITAFTKRFPDFKSQAIFELEMLNLDLDEFVRTNAYNAIKFLKGELREITFSRGN